ncbi:DUF3992 domain-containing protein [Paenibacillus radicis (ex Xue et al. 2023)]|uniref:DUF3992 domain-containing protein n=1 Tax=Paenibacillus radicis (ex Xue et al. 2023) TaxID=2972489 RepID=A0ABT1YBJ2_9BACL|nr:S-Ena type endospore appendage [Paenibacillus radicis (ex Xue et al. 2023)]MCR8630566.1 DUF3992 domain-containing protein [Paenibacillus radicis (ex Xue et al. 2023)]
MSGCSCNNQALAVGNHECCSQTSFVQDKLCATYTLTTATPQVIYALNTNPTKTFVSGTISLDSGPTGGTVAVTFLLGATIVETDTLTVGASLAFTKSGFTSITLTGTGAAPFTPPYQGEFCLTPRYPLG